ncbi:flavodoxin domain-containing protein [Actinomycetes bacterium KLBMP 9797]
MTVLVAYGSNGGSTAEIAEWIGGELRDAGLAAEVRPAGEVRDVTRYEAFVLGGAIYATGWHVDARRFGHRFAAALAGRPVWIFSSGPLDRSADETELPPVPQVKVAMRALGARGSVTFGGRLSDSGRGWLGFISRRMARRGFGGDFRNRERIAAWARRIASEIKPATAVDTSR